MSITVDVTVKKGDVRKWRLIVTKEIGSEDIKYSFTNSKASLRTHIPGINPRLLGHR
jgi:hypothetical protein